MPKVYIASAFRSLSNREAGSEKKAYGEIVNDSYIAFLEKIEEVFLNFGFDTCLPHRDEGMWGKVYYEPSSISPLCFRHVETSDVFFALAESGRGVHIELGYAAYARKKLLLTYKSGSEPSTLIWGLPKDISPWSLGFGGETDAAIFQYDSESDLLKKLTEMLEQEYGVDSSLTPNTPRKHIAIIDIGSHTLKLKIFSYRRGGASRVLYTEKFSLGIMKDVLDGGLFTQETTNALATQLQIWRGVCEKLSCDEIVATGTAALRKAQNTDELLSTLKDKADLRVEIISAEGELNYIYSAVRSTFPAHTALAVLNLGGGSTQIGIGKNTVPTESVYLDFGTRELTERWTWNKSMTQDTYTEMLNEVEKRVSKAFSNKQVKAERLVHTGGELDFLLKCQVPLALSRLSPQHVSEISVDAFKEFSQKFSASDPHEICSKYNLDPAWAAGAVASNVIAISVAEAVGALAIIPSNLNISDGILIK